VSDHEALSNDCDGLCGLVEGMVIQIRSCQSDVHCGRIVQNVGVHEIELCLIDFLDCRYRCMRCCWKTSCFACHPDVGHRRYRRIHELHSCFAQQYYAMMQHWESESDGAVVVGLLEDSTRTQKSHLNRRC
jgi:hypothetical protein